MSFELVRISSADGSTRAAFVPAAGMLGSSLEYLDEELLDPGRGVEAYADRGKTMAMPLLYPWANRLADFAYAAAGKRVALPDDPRLLPRDPNGLPIHGVIPDLMRWEAQASGATLRASLEWRADRLLELFPFRHTARVDVAVAAGELTVTTTIEADTHDPVPVCFGYHPYLRVLEAPREQWSVQLPPCERLRLNAHSIPTGEREPLGPVRLTLGETAWDDGLLMGELPARFAATAGGRGTSLELLEGYPYGQIYAPPGHDYVCFEPMTAPTDALRSGEGRAVSGAVSDPHLARLALTRRRRSSARRPRSPRGFRHK
jgi:galactose mutarotase-like enzyme